MMRENVDEADAENSFVLRIGALPTFFARIRTARPKCTLSFRAATGDDPGASMAAELVRNLYRFSQERSQGYLAMLPARWQPVKRVHLLLGPEKPPLLPAHCRCPGQLYLHRSSRPSLPVDAR
jgi:hypothetical protein